MKRTGGLWERLISFENLHEAARRAALGKKNRPDVAVFLMEQDNELVRLRQELGSGQYRPGPYREFRIDEPKPRLISAAPFRDRVVHHALTQVLEPIFQRRFSKDSFACRQGFGTHRALERAKALEVWAVYPSRKHLWVYALDGTCAMHSGVFASALLDGATIDLDEILV